MIVIVFLFVVTVVALLRSVICFFHCNLQTAGETNKQAIVWQGGGERG